MATITGSTPTVVSGTGQTMTFTPPAGTSSTGISTGSGNTLNASGAGNVNLFALGADTNGTTFDASGNSGNTKMFGGAGADTFIASTSGGHDVMTGFGGADSFDFNVGAGTHTVTDFVAAQDTIQLAAGLLSAGGFPGDLNGFLNANTSTVGSNSVITLGSGDTLQVNGIDKSGILNAATAGHITVV